MAARRYSAEEVDAAVARLVEPGRLEHASEVVTHAAPSLAAVLDDALVAGGWYSQANDEALHALAEAPEAERIQRTSDLVTEQTRIGMLVGVAVGFELARELELNPTPEET